MTRFSGRIPGPALLLVLAATLLVGARDASIAQRRFVLTGGTLINGIFERPLKDHVVVVDGGRITGVGRINKVIIPQGAETLDVTGKYIVPGLIDAHVHEQSPVEWARYLAWGITSVNCVYANADTALERQMWSRSDTLPAPAIHAAAEVGGVFASAADAREAVRALHGKGITRVEVKAGDVSDAMTAAIDEARRLRMLPIVQAPLMDDAAAALTAGAGAFVSVILDRKVDAAFVEGLLSADAFVMPGISRYRLLSQPDTFLARVLADTLFRNSLTPEAIATLSSEGYVAELRARSANAPEIAGRLRTVDENTATLAGNYVQLALGSDLWELPGLGVHLELEEMVRTGLSPMQALTSATFLSAKLLRILNKTGTVEPGKDADLLVLDADPLADIRNTRAVSMVVKKGKIFRPGELLGTLPR